MKKWEGPTFESLRRGAYGSPWAWESACRTAAEEGWTVEEIQKVLFVYHPLTWILGSGVMLLVGTAVWMAWRLL